jgi:hypothetical protein
MHNIECYNDVSDELGRLWKEPVVAYFEVLSAYFAGGTEGRH